MGIECHVKVLDRQFSKGTADASTAVFETDPTVDCVHLISSEEDIGGHGGELFAL